MRQVNCGEVIRLLRGAGYVLDRIAKDAHWVFVHPDKPGEWIIIPMHGKKELSRGVEAVIRRALRKKR